MSEIQRYIAKTQELPKPHKTYIADEIVVRNDAHESALRQRDERIAALEKALRNLCDSIEAAGGHDENGDVFDLTEAIVALEAK